MDPFTLLLTAIGIAFLVSFLYGPVVSSMLQVNFFESKEGSLVGLVLIAIIIAIVLGS